MRVIWTAAVFIGLALPASAFTDRFEPDNPWYEHFAVDCRDGDKMLPECRQGVLAAYQNAQGGAQEVSCDFAKFWAVSDEKMKGKYFPVLPWQYGVEAILREPGVCTSY